MTPAVDPDLRAAAESALGLKPQQGSHPARVSFFQRLDAYEFSPPDEVTEAAAALGVLPSGDGPLSALERYRSRRLEGEIERFAAEYWDLDLVDRRSRWVQLNTEADSAPRATVRLQQLSAGLDLEPPSADGWVGKLVRIIRDLYPLAPASRAEARRAWAQRVGSHVAELHAAAEVLKYDHPRWAALAPDLLDALPISDRSLRRAGYDFRSGLRALKAQYPNWWIAPVAIILLIGVIAIAASTAKRSNEPYTGPYEPKKSVPYEPKKFVLPKDWNKPLTVTITTRRPTRP